MCELRNVDSRTSMCGDINNLITKHYQDGNVDGWVPLEGFNPLASMTNAQEVVNMLKFAKKRKHYLENRSDGDRVIDHIMKSHGEQVVQYYNTPSVQESTFRYRNMEEEEKNGIITTCRQISKYIIDRMPFRNDAFSYIDVKKGDMCSATFNFRNPEQAYQDILDRQCRGSRRDLIANHLTSKGKIKRVNINAEQIDQRLLFNSIFTDNSGT